MTSPYPDGNTYAERQHNAARDDEPTDSELESFVEDWLDTKRKKLGIEYISEALIERKGDIGLMEIFKAWNGQPLDFSDAVKKAIDDYWRPMAERDAEYHDFAEDRGQS